MGEVDALEVEIESGQSVKVGLARMVWVCNPSFQDLEIPMSIDGNMRRSPLTECLPAVPIFPVYNT
jgi:hypothetical protein